MRAASTCVDAVAVRIVLDRADDLRAGGVAGQRDMQPGVTVDDVIAGSALDRIIAGTAQDDVAAVERNETRSRKSLPAR